MSFYFSKQAVSQMTAIMLYARNRFQNLSDPGFRSLIVQGIVHSYEIMIEREFIISEYDQSYHRSHADQSDQLDSRKVVYEVGIQVSQASLSSKRPAVQVEQFWSIQQPNSQFKKNEHQNIKEKVEKLKPQSFNLSSRDVELQDQIAENVLAIIPTQNREDSEAISAFAREYSNIEREQSIPQGSINPNTYSSRLPPSKSISQPFIINEDQKILQKRISSKLQQVRIAAEDASSHAKFAENYCFLVKQFAENAMRLSSQRIKKAQENEAKAIKFQNQTQKQVQETKKEVINCNRVVRQIINLLQIVDEAEQMQPSVAVRLTKTIFRAFKAGGELTRTAQNSLNQALRFAQEAATYADKAKSTVRKAEEQIAIQNSSKDRNPQEIFMLKKRVKGSEQDEKKLIDLQHQISQHRLKMKREALSIQRQQ